MDDDLHDIDKLFYDALEPEAQQPSEKVWSQINTALDESDSKKTLAYFTSKKILALVAVLLFATFVVIKFTSNNHKQIIAKNEKNISSDSNDQIAKNSKVPFYQKKNTQKSLDTTSAKNIKIANAKINVTVNKTETILEPTKRLPNSENNKQSNSRIVSNNVKQQIISTNKSNLHSRKQNLTRGKTNDGGNTLNNFDITDGSGIKPVGIQKRITNNQEQKTALKNLSSQSNSIEQDDRQLLLHSFIPNDIQASNAQFLAVANANIHPNSSLALKSLQSNTSKKAGSKSTVSLVAKRSRWYISAFGAQEWQGYQLQDNDDNNMQQQPNTNDNKNSIRHREDEDPSLAAGINIGYQFGKKLSLETGVRFGGYHIRTDSAKIFAESNSGVVEYKLITSTGYAYLKGVGGSLPVIGDSATAQKVKQAINYIGIPLLLRYKIGNGKLTFNPAVGFVFNFITNSTVSANLNGQGNDQQRVSLSGLSKFSAVIMFNPSIYYSVTKKISLGLEPYFNYSISPINNTNVVKSYPYALGIGAGIKYSL